MNEPPVRLASDAVPCGNATGVVAIRELFGAMVAGPLAGAISSVVVSAVGSVAVPVPMVAVA